jgi:hypothetical protein
MDDRTFICRLSSQCFNGTSEIPPWIPAEDELKRCPHEVPHEKTYDCRNLGGCTWSNRNMFAKTECTCFDVYREEP